MASFSLGQLLRTLFRIVAGLILAPFGYGKEVALCVVLIACSCMAVSTWHTWCSRSIVQAGSAAASHSISRLMLSPRQGEMVLFRDFEELATIDDSGEELWHRKIRTFDQFQLGQNSSDWSFFAHDLQGLYWWNSVWGDVVLDAPVASSRIKDVSLSRDGRQAAILRDSNVVQLCRLNDDGSTETQSRWLGDGTNKVCLSTHGRRIAVRTKSSDLQFLDLSESAKTSPLIPVGCVILSQAWSGDENWFALGTEQRQVHVWRADGDPRPVYTVDVPQIPWTIVLSEDGRSLFVAFPTGALAAWRDGRQLWTREPYAGGVRALDLSLDGKCLASGCLQGRILIHDAETGEIIREIRRESH